MKTAISTLVLAALAGSASAQCNVFKYGVPDFDQRRDFLPGNGGMYCVPTSALNWMAYIANHGRPQAMGHSSPDWSSMTEYALVDQLDFSMGFLMGTSASGGTNLAGAVAGTVSYMANANVGPAIVIGYHSDEDWQVSPKLMHDHMKSGHLVNMCFGRYQWDGDDWDRVGGHCMSVCAVFQACGSTPTVSFHDPNTSDSINTQSTFTTSSWSVTKQMREFDGDWYQQWGPAGQSGTNTTQRFIDGVMAIVPLFVLTEQPGNLLANLNVPFLNNDDTPPRKFFAPPGGLKIMGASPDLRRLSSFVVTRPAEFMPARLWDFSHADERFTPIMDLPVTPGAFTVDRRGDILLGVSGGIHKYRYSADGSVRLLSSADVGVPVDCIAVDDATDDLYALSAEQRTLRKFPGGDLGAAPFVGTLPAAIPLGIAPCIAINPADGKPWLCSEGSGSIYQLSPVATGGWVVGSLVQTGAASRPSALQFDDHGDMKFISTGFIREWDRDPGTGRYALSSDPLFPGEPAAGFLSLARSRTNFDPLKHTGPAWDNIEDPDLDPEVIDCPADINGDGFVDGIDYDEFNNLFEAGDIDADVNFDGFVDGIDYDTFNNWFEQGC